MFVGEVGLPSSLLECASGNVLFEGIGTVHLETTEANMTIENLLYVPELTVSMLCLINYA